MLYFVITILTIILNFADLMFTNYWVQLYGIDVEANPIGRWVLEDGIRMIIFKFLIPTVLIIVLFVLRENAVAAVGLIVVFVVYFALVVYHVVIWFNVRRH